MKRKIIYYTTGLIFAALQVSGCGRAAGSDVVLARIGAKKVTVADFNARIANLPKRYRSVVEKKKGEYLEELVNDTLLYQEAIRKKLYKDKDVQKVIDEARKKILIARLLQDEVDDTINVTEDDILKFYNDNKQKYMTPEVMRVSHILVLSKEEAQNILKELLRGGAFDGLARARSVDPTAQRGGDIGYFPKGQLMPEFENACARLKVGQISGVVKTKLGYHIIKLTDRRAPQLRPIEQVKDDIKARVHAVTRRKLFNKLLSDLRDRTVIKINEDVLTSGEKPDEVSSNDKKNNKDS